MKSYNCRGEIQHKLVELFQREQDHFHGNYPKNLAKSKFQKSQHLLCIPQNKIRISDKPISCWCRWCPRSVTTRVFKLVFQATDGRKAIFTQESFAFCRCCWVHLGFRFLGEEFSQEQKLALQHPSKNKSTSVFLQTKPCVSTAASD